MRSQKPFIRLCACGCACAWGSLAGRLESECCWRGGVGRLVGRLAEAELRRAMEGSRDEQRDDG